MTFIVSLLSKEMSEMTLLIIEQTRNLQCIQAIPIYYNNKHPFFNNSLRKHL